MGGVNVKPLFFVIAVPDWLLAVLSGVGVVAVRAQVLGFKWWLLLVVPAVLIEGYILAAAIAGQGLVLVWCRAHPVFCFVEDGLDFVPVAGHRRVALVWLVAAHPLQDAGCVHESEDHSVCVHGVLFGGVH